MAKEEHCFTCGEAIVAGLCLRCDGAPRRALRISPDEIASLPEAKAAPELPRPDLRPRPKFFSAFLVIILLALSLTCALSTIVFSIWMGFKSADKKKTELSIPWVHS